MKAFIRFNDLVAAAVKLLVILMVLTMLGALTAQVVLRYAFNITLSWSEELSITLFTWTVLLMAALGVREGFHVRMSLVVERLPAALRGIVERVIYLATTGVGGFLTWSGWRYFDDTHGTISAAIGYPIEYLHASALVCGALITLFALEAMLEGRIPDHESPSEDRV